MRSALKVLLITGSLVAASFGASAAAAATAPPVMDTSTFACSGTVCEVGPGNVGMPFGAGLNVTGDGVSGRFYGDDFRMTIISGALPPGLQLSLPSTEWTVTGTPTQAGTYSFTVQFTPTQDVGGGPAGTQQLTISISTGSSDRLVVTGAAYNGHQSRLYVAGYDVNLSALYSVSVTATGKLLIGAQPNHSAWNDGFLALSANVNDPCGTTHSCNITVTDSLGSSVTVTLPPAKY
jgi:hypothetical protein